MPAPRILILAPHPDDEVVGCAAAIGRARTGGARLFLLTLTTGVPAADRLWPWDRARCGDRVRRRRDEALQAALALAIEPVESLDLPSRTLRCHLPMALAAVERACAGCRAGMLWVPAYEGGHQDHDAANAIGALFRSRLPVWEFSEYNFAGGSIRRQEFPQPAGDAIRLHLTSAEMTRKRDLLTIYRSERGNLHHVGCRQETFRPLIPYDYARPPHPGRLFYERFHWFPMPHPRIDRTTSAEVSRDLVEFFRRMG